MRAGALSAPATLQASSFQSFREESVAVRIRLTRVGGKKNPIWRVVVADQRSPRDGRVHRDVGHYNPQTEPSTIVARRGARPRTGSTTAPSRPTGAQAAEDPGHHRLSAARRCASCSSSSSARSSTTPTRSRSRSSRRTTARSCSSCRVAEDDYGRVIGRGGRTANALRTVVKAAAVQGEPPRARRHRRLIVALERADWLPAGRVGRAARPRRLLLRDAPAARAAARSARRSASASARREIVRRAGHRRAPDPAPRRASTTPRGGRGAARRGPAVPARARRPRSARTSGGPRTSRAAASSTASARSGVVRAAGRAAVVRGARGRARRARAELLVPLVRDAVRCVDVARAA